MESRPDNHSSSDFEKQFPPWEFVGQTYFGNFCTVYQARPRNRNVPAAYAVKVLKSEWCHNEVGLALMYREVEVGRKVSHPHLVPVLDADLKSDIPYLVQPWLEGKTIRDYLAGGRHARFHETLWVTRQVTEALVALETVGYCHADIKPGNIHVSLSGHVTLIDLGTSRRLGQAKSPLDLAVCGTPEFMAPELRKKEAFADIRSDIYSLGRVMQSMTPEISQELPELMDRMTAPRPENRPASARQLLRELVALEIQFV